MKRPNSIFSFVSTLLMTAVLVFGCSDDENPPQNTLSPDQMASILTDIHVAESRVTRLQLRSLDSSLMIFKKLKTDIWKKYKVDTLVYSNSYSYYMTHPKQMALIYEKVNKKIEILEKTNSTKL